MAAQLETIFTEIVSPRYVWLETVIEPWDFRDPQGDLTGRESHRGQDGVIEPAGAEVVPDYGDRRVIRVGDDLRTSLGLKEGTVGWQEVRQLAFAFQEEDWPRVRAFYATSGPLGDPECYRMLPGVRERVGWARAALDWFRELTVLVEALQNGRTGQLWDYFGKPRELSLLEQDTPIYFAGPHLRGNDPVFGYSIRWVPMLGDDKRCRSPQNEAELVAATWEAVTQAVEYELSRVSLTLIRRDVKDALHPRLHWGFQAGGALHEAFLDWFLRIFAPLKVATCAANGCKNPVTVPGRVYCSTVCKNRQKQKDYRERQKQRTKARR